jgi:alkylresorcinol/alkylpyrone synthase
VPHSWQECTSVYREQVTELFVTTARAALTGPAAVEADTEVTVSSTGIAGPSLEARAASDLGRVVS